MSFPTEHLQVSRDVVGFSQIAAFGAVQSTLGLIQCNPRALEPLQSARAGRAAPGLLHVGRCRKSRSPRPSCPLGLKLGLQTNRFVLLSGKQRGPKKANK